MFILTTQGKTKKLAVSGRVSGFRIKTLELDGKDIMDLYNCTNEQLRNWIDHMITRIPPCNYEDK